MRTRDPLYQFLAREMIECHAENEWIAYLTYRDFHRRTRSERAKHLQEEELEHFRMLEAIYPKGWGALSRAVKRRIRARRLPQIRSEIELSVVSWIFDQAGLVQLRGVRDSSWRAYAKVVRRILVDEQKHLAGGLRGLRSELRSRRHDRARLRRLAGKWLELSRAAFGQPDSLLDRRAVGYRLKRKSSHRQLKDFETSISRAWKSFGARNGGGP